jgi:hypothetical protein
MGIMSPFPHDWTNRKQRELARIEQAFGLLSIGVDVKALLTRSQNALVLASGVRPTAHGVAAGGEKLSVVSVE